MKSDINTMHTFGSELSCYDPHWPLEPEPRKPAAGPPASSCTRVTTTGGAAGRGAARDRAGDAKSVSDSVRVSRRTRELKNTSGGLGGPWARD